MQELLDLILKNITTHPEDAVIQESTEGDVTVYTITVHPEDMGRVIGKDGKVIRAIRSLAHVVAIRQGKRYRITLNDTSSDKPETTTQPKSGAPSTPEGEDKTETSDDLIAGAIDMNPDDSKDSSAT